LKSDGLGRVWQRWNYDSGGEEWAAMLTRYNYDGAALVHVARISPLELPARKDL
jgi:hypothetical protein